MTCILTCDYPTICISVNAANVAELIGRDLPENNRTDSKAQTTRPNHKRLISISFPVVDELAKI